MNDIKAPVKAENTKNVVEEKSHYTDGMIFPKTFPKTIYVRRVPIPARIPGQVTDEALLKIGSSYKGNAPLKGLTFQEEARFLPSIIGVDSSSPNWEAQTRDYWANISKPVPPGDGLELEVGLRYNSKEDYIHDTEVAERDINGTILNGKGIPLSTSDYILWRYCLLYSRVANTFEQRGLSPKIEFYLFSKERETMEKKAVLLDKRKAQSIMFKRLAEREWVTYVLRVLMSKDPSNPVSKLLKMTDDEKDVLLDEYVTGNPVAFLALAEDKNLETRSFIEECITLGKLTRIPNTDTVTMDGVTLGNSTTEVVTFLQNPKNVETLNILKAQLKHLPQ